MTAVGTTPEPLWPARWTRRFFGRHTALMTFVVGVCWMLVQIHVLWMERSIGSGTLLGLAPQVRSTNHSLAMIQHPYVHRTGNRIPHWATKHETVYDPLLPTICFVHVGKTAGTTLACRLGFHYECKASPPATDSLLARQTTNVMHNSVVEDCGEPDYYLFSLRDPLERIQSWFIYEQPPDEDRPEHYSHAVHYENKKLLFTDCEFDTLQDLARGIAGGSNATCRERAMSALRGTHPYSRHNYYNYRYFQRQMPPSAVLLGIRSEFLERDWLSVESLLCKKAGLRLDMQPVTFSKENKSLPGNETVKPLSQEARFIVCRELCEEIQMYKQLLRRSVNLLDKDVDESMKILRNNCPVEAVRSTC